MCKILTPILMGAPPPHTHTAAAAESLQSCLTLCDPIDGSPPGSPVPGIFQARTLEWVAISFSNAWKWKVKVKSLSHVRPSETPWTAAFQAPPSMGFSRQEYWSGVPLPSPHTHLLSNTSRGCYNSPQFWHYIPGNSFRSHRWRASSLQNSLPTPNRCQLKVQIFTCTSDSLAICRLEVPRTPSWGMINLLEQHTELRETFYYVNHRFI